MRQNGEKLSLSKLLPSRSSKSGSSTSSVSGGTDVDPADIGAFPFSAASNCAAFSGSVAMTNSVTAGSRHRGINGAHVSTMWKAVHCFGPKWVLT